MKVLEKANFNITFGKAMVNTSPAKGSKDTLG